MYLAAHGAMLIALVVSLAGAAVACYGGWHSQFGKVKLLEQLQSLAAILVVFASGGLLYALLTRDFSLSYVARYTDSTLPFFYTLSAFWAGQEGSLLFWELLIALSGFLLIKLPGYSRLSSKHKLYFWMFFLAAQAFFLLLLTAMSNPFTALPNPPLEGQGLNPMLRNIGMILHPPLLFFGYAGFTIPACLALGAVLAGEQKAWNAPAHNWILASWVALTAGILLGCWWAYMELGWGGYWAWDPVENASLIPWFSATALLHTRIVERKFGYLARSSVLLVCVTFILCIFATYLVRSGAVQSLHAFGEGAVSIPLLLGVAFSGLISVLVYCGMPREGFQQLPPLGTRVGMIVVLVWLLLGLGLIVLLGTIWPLISQLWETVPAAVNQDFYNTICLPLFTAMTMLLAVAPWLGWKDENWKPKFALISLGIWVVILCIGFMQGIRPLLAVAGVASAAAVFVTVGMLFFVQGKAARSKTFIAAHGTHLAFALIVFGVAVSGPFAKTWESDMGPGESVSVEEYTFTYKDLRKIQTEELAINEAVIEVKKNNVVLGELLPQQRLYRNYDHPNSEVSTLFSLGAELYATIHDIENGRLRPLRISVHPMINWLWLGCILICFLPLFIWRKNKNSEGEI
ncbi:MAG: cytochrome c biogenesis protein CcsA [Deltaproteobacteria bacterium]|jgi:cytochrome c-type biogenesis protein CcmF|nr:cytochrome c biogenesis protein CcsA [Deltaproteobacteria bacterium]